MFFLFIPFATYAYGVGSDFKTTQEILGESQYESVISGIEKAKNHKVGDNFQTTEEILKQYRDTNPTECASKIFADALRANADKISDTNTEAEVEAWAKYSMHEPEILKQVLKCPEINNPNVSDDTTIVFTPIEYTFPDDTRKITINYSTQPKVLKQILILSTKPSLPTDDPNPKLMNPDDPATYINTEPAWYAVMVVQHGTLSEFVGPDKNNVVSLKWINDNIQTIYPVGYHCTSRSAWANDDDTINQVVRKVVDLEDDSNDYYVAGDLSLEWVMYAEIAADVIITIATWGGGTVVSGLLKNARATRVAKNLRNSIKVLRKSKQVTDYVEVTGKIVQHADDIEKLGKNIKNAKKYEQALKNANAARKAGNAKKAAKYEKQAQQIFKNAKKIDQKMTTDMLKKVDKLEDAQKELKNSMKTLQKTASEMEHTVDEVKMYKKQVDAFREMQSYIRTFKHFRRPQTGNIITRTLRTIIKSRNGAQSINKAARVARAGMSSRSAKIGDWLWHTTLKHGSRLAKFEAKAGLFYGAVSFLGDMYDQTSSTSKEFSNGIEFKPFCLLSADDIEGQENVVNYGMWLMWTGNSTDPSDDDAAFLQSMDFASKFHSQLEDFQDKHGAECNVDIYVVRPLIRLDERDIDNPKGEMYYLFMNDIPWTTSAQFGDQIENVEDWERNQERLEAEDPKNKYKKPENKENTSLESGNSLSANDAIYITK